MGDFGLDANFIEALDRILDNADLSLDRRLELAAGLLNRQEPAPLKEAAGWEDEEVARAFLEFVAPTGEDQGTRERPERLLNALIGATEFKRRAQRAGLTTLQYAHLIRIRRELGDA